MEAEKSNLEKHAYSYIREAVGDGRYWEE